MNLLNRFRHQFEGGYCLAASHLTAGEAGALQQAQIQIPGLPANYTNVSYLCMPVKIFYNVLFYIEKLYLH